MKRFLILIPACLMLLAGSVAAQHRQCGSMEVLERQLLENPSIREAREAIEQHARTFAANGGATDRTVVTIPVVVHVVWRTAAENVSDAQIQSQLTVLNDDFRKLNADANLVPPAFQSLAADCEINFCLAQQDPNGAATTGIQRRQTTVTAFGTNDNMKFFSTGGLNAWDASKYLNLWVCNLSGGVLGYAQFPGGPANTDGVVITYTAFGTTGSATPPFNKGRTGTHEVGHWLNLNHIWGDDGTACTGSDNCADTPNQADENYGCPTFPQISCNNGPNGDMFMNYMDYTDDACMYMFTTGQKNRAQAVLATGGARASLATSPGCQAPGGGGSCGTPGALAASGITSSSATLGWGAVSGATSYNLQWKTSAATTWTTVSSLTTTSFSLSGLAASTTYNYRVQAVCTTSGSYSAASNFTTLAASSCGTPSGLNATSITTSSATLNWAAVAGATSYSLQRKLASSSTWTTTNNLSATSFSLTGLSANTSYNYRVRATCGTLNGVYSATATFTTAPASCTDQFEPNNSRTGAYTGTPVGTAFTAQIATVSDVDWYRFANTSTQRNIKIELTTLPADYDLRLFRNSGQVGISENLGTANELIILNNATVSTSYFANVYGYNGAFSNASCYTLRISLSATAWRTDGSTDGPVEEIEVPVSFEDTGFAIFPNPAADAATLEIPMTEEADVQIAVLDPAGRAAVQTTQSLGKANNRVNLDLSRLAAGIYFVQVRNGSETATRKLVVNK